MLPFAKDFNLHKSNLQSIAESDITAAHNPGNAELKNETINIKKEEDTSIFKVVDKINNLENRCENREQLFSRKSGNSGISGQLYEIKLLISFLLQGAIKTRRFYLATNIQEAGEFDDIVFKYENRTGESKIIFFQAKHREYPEKDKITVEQLFSESKRGDFNLKKYFNSYLKIKQQFLKGREDKIFGSKFEDVHFIIYTNALSTFKKNEESIEKVALEQDSILNWSEKSSYYYKVVTRGQKNEEKISVLQYSSDCKKLADELAKSIFSQQGIVINKGVLGDYHIPLAGEVIQRKDKAKEGTMKESFLNSNSQFKKAFFEEIGKMKEFAGKSEAELKSILLTKRIKVCDNFGKINTRDGKYPELLPNDVVSESDIKEFLSLLKLFVEQSSEEDLSKTIKQKIRDIYRVTPQDVDSVFSDVQNRVLEWWKRGNYYLTETNRIFQDAARVSIKFDVKEPVTLFTGRIKELQNLHKILQDGGEAVISQMASVTGLGGIGKSELARKYISEHGTDYDDNVIWINADNYLTTVESFRRLAQDRLQIRTKDENGKEREIILIVQDVYFFFAKRHRRSLFIFDNAGKYKAFGRGEGIDTFLPSDSNKPFGPNKPFVLITSRFQEWGEIKALPLDVFTGEEAVEFIRKALMDVIELEEKEVKRLGEELQYLPLALNQAVAYIKMENKGLNEWKEGNFTIGRYLEQFKEKADELLSKSPSVTTERYTKTVMTTWEVTIEKIKQKVCGIQALEVLSLIAYLAPNNIPIEDVFSNLISEEEERHTAVELLDQYSMAHLECGRLNIHRLVQHVTRVIVERQGKENDVIDQTFKLLYKSFPYDKDTLEDYSKQKKLLPHLEAFLSCLEDLLVKRSKDKQKIEEYYIENLLTWMSHGYFVLGNPRRQMELLEQCLPLVEKHYSSDHYEVATTLVNLSNAYGAQGVTAKQKDLLERALEIEEKHNRSHHVGFARILVNLGIAYGDLGDHQKQREYLERALEIKEKHYGSDHFEVARTLVNLGNAYNDLGEYEVQKELLHRALAIDERYYGPHHFEFAGTLVNLGITYGDLGDYQKQKELLERALPILEKHYDPDNFQVATVQVNLGIACGELGDYQEKRDLLELALPILEKHYGPDRYEIAVALGNLGNTYGDFGDHHKQKDLLERALEIKEKCFGSDHYLIAETLVDLGITYGELGDHKKRKELLKRALIIEEKHHGMDHPAVAVALVNLGNAYGDLGKHHKQKVCLERALTIEEKYYGLDHFEVAITLVNLGNAYGILGNHQKQKKLLKRALVINEKKYGQDHFEVAMTLGNLSNAYGALGDFQKQKELLERALPIDEKHFGHDHIQIAKTLGNLGIAYGNLGDNQKKKEFLEQALKIFKEQCIPYHFEVAKTLGNLGGVYVDLGDHQEGKVLLEQALHILEKEFEKDYFEIAKVLHNLGIAYGELGDYQKQKDLLERALQIEEKHYKSDHQEVATTLLGLNHANENLGHF